MTRRTRRFSPRIVTAFPSGANPAERGQISPHRQHDPQAQRSLPAAATPGAQRELADALGQFLRASDWLAALRVLLAHPVLLTEHVSKLLRDLADASRRQNNITDEISMLTHLIFLEDVRRRGFFTVHNELYEKGAWQ